MQVPRVLALARELGGALDGCLKWRCLEPITELQRQGYKGIGWDFLNNGWFAYQVVKPEAILFERLHWPPGEWEKGELFISTMHKAGIAVIYEIDDDLFSDDLVSRLVNVHGKDPQAAEGVRQSVIHTIKLCDGVTVSSEHLAVAVGRLTDKPIVVVPNFIDLPRFRAAQKGVRRVIKPLTIGWAGGARPDSDVEQMAIAWGRIARRYPHVTFVLQGHQPQVIYDNVPNGRVAAIEWMPIETYPAGMVNIDIGCCPLSPSYFNRHKTYIKAMEYAATGAAVVASPTVYRQIIEHGKDGYICETADEWEAALAELVESANTRKRLAQRLLAKVEAHHTLEQNAWRWLVAWQAIIEDYQQRQIKIVTPVRYGRGERVHA